MRGLLCVALLVASACAASPPKSKLQQAVSQGRMSPDELRIRVRALAGPFSGQIEAFADEIARRSPDPQTRFAVTRFKINAIPALQSTLFEPDPVAALIDSWVLLAQLEDAITTYGVGRDESMRALASERVRGIEREIE